MINQYLIPQFGSKRLKAIKAKHVAEFQISLVKDFKLAPQSVANILSILSSIFRFAVLLELVDINPCSGISRVKRATREPTFWSFAERDKFLNFCRNHDYKIFQLVAFAVTTGLRPCKLQGLQRSRLDFENCRVLVDQN